LIFQLDSVDKISRLKILPSFIIGNFACLNVIVLAIRLRMAAINFGVISSINFAFIWITIDELGFINNQ
jgi:hypothetical protein